MPTSVLALLRAVLLVLLAHCCACSSDGTATDPRASPGLGGSGTEASLPVPAHCESYRDAVASETAAISIRNTGTLPLFVQATAPDCSTDASLVEVLRDGQPLRFPAWCGAVSCARFLDRPPPLQEKRGGCSCGPRSEYRLLAPQEVVKQGLDLELAPRELPASCSGESALGAIPCFARVLPAPASYTLVVRAVRELACVELPATDAGESRDAGRGCSERMTDLLTFSLATANYFQDHEIELSAP